MNDVLRTILLVTAIGLLACKEGAARPADGGALDSASASASADAAVARYWECETTDTGCVCDNQATTAPQTPATCAAPCCYVRIDDSGAQSCRCVNDAYLSAHQRSCAQQQQSALLSCQDAISCNAVDACPLD